MTFSLQVEEISRLHYLNLKVNQPCLDRYLDSMQQIKQLAQFLFLNEIYYAQQKMAKHRKVNAASQTPLTPCLHYQLLL